MIIYQVKSASQRLVDAFEELLPQLDTSVALLSFQELESIISSSNTILFAGEENDKIVGTLSLVLHQIPTGRKAWIEDVIVDESVRGKGYGKQLIRHAIAFAGSKGFTSLYLTSRPSRVEANRMYQNLGFVERKTNVYQIKF
ncbi:MAG: GNAT family N-acetyltransferase [Paludibacteraceae bacterium]